MRAYLERLRGEGKLRIVEREVSPHNELAAVTQASQAESDAALLFRKVQGSRYPVMTNVFGSYTNQSEFITFLLARTNLGVSSGGIFTVGEVDSDWTNITNQTQIPVVQELGQWIALMDGVIVNGQNYSGHGLL